MNKREDTYDLSVFVFKIVMWLIFGFFILIFKGIQSLLRREWGQALAWFAIPGILVIVALFLMVTSNIQGRALDRERQADQAERQWALSNPSQAYTFEKLQSSLEIIPGCNNPAYVGQCDETKGTLFSEYKLTNRLQRSILQLSPVEQELGNTWPYSLDSCMTKWLEFNINYENTLSPGESVNLYCVEKFNNKPVTPCVDLVIYPFDTLTTACGSN